MNVYLLIYLFSFFLQAAMTAIKHTLQREVFLPAEERLVGLVHVTKAGKKKKSSFLCAAGGF